MNAMQQCFKARQLMRVLELTSNRRVAMNDAFWHRSAPPLDTRDRDERRWAGTLQRDLADNDLHPSCVLKSATGSTPRHKKRQTGCMGCFPARLSPSPQGAAIFHGTRPARLAPRLQRATPFGPAINPRFDVPRLAQASCPLPTHFAYAFLVS